MDRNTAIKVKMLGGFELSCGGNCVKESRPRKTYVLLAYLLLHRGRDISQAELVEAVWGEEKVGEVTQNALKALCFRVREILSVLRFPEPLIIPNNGSYKWNPEVNIELDVDQLDSLCKQAVASNDPEQKKELYEEVLHIYNGELLPGKRDCSWVIPLSAYYHNVFIRAAHGLMEIYREREDYTAIVTICKRVLEFDILDEETHRELIHAYQQMKNYTQAYEQYYYAKDVYYREGVNFPEELRSIYGSIAGELREVKLEIEKVQEALVREEKETAGGFLCEYQFFRDFYRVQCHAYEREQKEVCLYMFSIVGISNRLPDKKMLNKYMDSLREVILELTEQSDIVTRYSMSQYLVCICNVAKDSVKSFEKRVQSCFRKACPRKDIVLDCQHIFASEKKES